MSDDYVLMPKELTAENGAKALMMGEFYVETDIECPECIEDKIYGIWGDNDECELCNDLGFIIKKVPIDWSTIKEMYAFIEKHLSK